MNEFELLRSEFSFKHDQASDYIWKSPNFIEQERNIEKRKLEAYFPNDKTSAALRWSFESKKLDDVFPKAIAMSNLFYAASLFEIYMLRLAYIVDKKSISKFSDCKGMGISKILKYLKANKINYIKNDLWPTVDALLKIRNCLAHANGHLDFVKNSADIYNIVSNRHYLTPAQKKIRTERLDAGKKYTECVWISDNHYGKFLSIDNDCAHIGLHTFFRFFFDLCSIAENNCVASSLKCDIA